MCQTGHDNPHKGCDVGENLERFLADDDQKSFIERSIEAAEQEL